MSRYREKCYYMAPQSQFHTSFPASSAGLLEFHVECFWSEGVEFTGLFREHEPEDLVIDSVGGEPLYTTLVDDLMDSVLLLVAHFDDENMVGAVSGVRSGVVVAEHETSWWHGENDVWYRCVLHLYNTYCKDKAHNDEPAQLSIFWNTFENILKNVLKHHMFSDLKTIAN